MTEILSILEMPGGKHGSIFWSARLSIQPMFNTGASCGHLFAGREERGGGLVGSFQSKAKLFLVLVNKS